MIFRWVLGVLVPAAVLGVSWFTDELPKAALAAGIASMIAHAVASLIIWIYLPWTTELSHLLFWWAVPLSVVTWGMGMSPLSAIVAGATLVALGAILASRHDMVALACVVLAVLAFASFMLVGIFGTWSAAAIAGSVTGFGSAVAAYGGGIRNFGWIYPLRPALYIAALPVGFFLWGVGVYWQLSAFLGALVATAGFVVGVAFREDPDCAEEF